MSQKRKITKVNVSIDYTLDDRREWYLDIYDKDDAHFQKVHLFVASDEDGTTFDDLGQVCSSGVSFVDGHNDVECINIEVRGNHEYQLSHVAYLVDRMVKNKELTMFSRGWQLDPRPVSEITIDELQDNISRVLKGKALKAPRPSKARKPISMSGSVDVDVAILEASAEGPSETKGTMRFVDPKLLEQKIQKAKKSDLGGMEQYGQWFPFKYKEFEIPVDNCFRPKDEYNSRQLEEAQVSSCMLFFAESSNRPAACAYLMPVKDGGPRRGTPMTMDEIQEGKILEYKYWIIDGQHSIYAAKYLRFQEMESKSGNKELIQVYEKRKARIVVNAPPQVATAISAIANEEAKALYVKQPYSDILKQLRSQWKFNKSPSKPTHGVTEGSTSRANWDAFLRMARLSAGVSFIAKQAHMVTYSEDVYIGWLQIIEQLEQANRKPSATVFRFLCGLDEEEVKKLQAEIRAGDIVLCKGSKDVGLIDMPERIKILKQDRLIQEAVLTEFNNIEKEEPCQNWEDLKAKYNINDVVYARLVSMCDAWVKARLKIGAKKLDFPEEAREYIDWTIKLRKEQSIVSTDLPWHIFVVSLQIEGKSYLERHFAHPKPIGLCVLDNTEDFENNMQLSKDKFSDLLNGILAITGGSTESQYVLLCFLKYTEYVELQCALQNMLDVVKKQFVGALHYVQNSSYSGAIEFFTVLIFLSNKDSFEDLSDSMAPGEQAMVLDAGNLDIDTETVQTMDNIEYLRLKKTLLTRHAIQKYCTEDRVFVDLFSDGFLSEIALDKKKEVICLVQTHEDQRKLAPRLLAFAQSHHHIKEWAKLSDEQKSKPNETRTESEETVGERQGGERVSSFRDFMDREESMI